MHMKKFSLVLCATMLAGISSQALAQVQDVSFTISPVAGYTRWDNKLNLGDAPYWGLRAGFGFGPLFEVRGLYERSFDLKGKLQSTANPNWLRDWADKLEDSKAEITRYGGELKLNLWSNAIVTPYLTAGGGVMKFTYTGTAAGSSAATDYKEEQIYGAGGVGLKFNLGQRVALSLEGKDLIFNVNEHNRYLASPTSGGKQLHNWTGQASLDIYFGGSTNRPADAVSRAYKNLYTGGFRGLKFAVEPGVAYVDFANGSGFEDQWFVGGSAGLDLSNIFGIRGFYYAATEKPSTLNLELNNDLRMYGGNFLARLNMPLGLTPYLNLGAGYLEATSKFTKSPSVTGDAKSGLFLFGGAGLEIPLHKYVAIYGNVNAMLTEQNNPDVLKVTDPESVKVGTFYQAGVRFNIGRSARDGRTLYHDYANDRVRSEVAIVNEANLEELNRLRAQYDARIKKLNQELADAVAERDNEKISRVLEEKDQVTKHISSVDAKTTQIAVAEPQGEKKVTLTKAQFDALVDRVVLDLKQQQVAQPQQVRSSLSVSDVTSSSLSDLDKILLLNALYRSPYAGQLLAPAQAPVQVAPQASAQQGQQTDATLALAKRLDQVVDRLDAINAGQQNAQQSNRLLESQIASALQQSNRDQQHIVVTKQDERGDVEAREIEVKKADEVFHLNRAAIFVGPNFGDQFNVNVGARAYLQIKDSKFDLAPDVYFGFLGDKTAFGINANLLYNLPTLFSGAVNPYLGVGLGFNNIGGTHRFLPNYVVGTSLNKVLGGSLFVDYTIRGAFRNNQLAVGYRFHI